MLMIVEKRRISELKRKKAFVNKDDVKGRLGGIARAKKLSAARRKEIAVSAANARWKK